MGQDCKQALPFIPVFSWCILRLTLSRLYSLDEIERKLSWGCNSGTVPEFGLKLMKTTAGVPAEIRILYLPNTNLQHYCYINQSDVPYSICILFIFLLCSLVRLFLRTTPCYYNFEHSDQISQNSTSKNFFSWKTR
jgi:hypothetical protein